MTNNPVLSHIQYAQEFAYYKQQVDALKKEQEDLLIQIRKELEEKKQQKLLANIRNN